MERGKKCDEGEGEGDGDGSDDADEGIEVSMFDRSTKLTSVTLKATSFSYAVSLLMSSNYLQFHDHAWTLL
jgi:hypothetical protein